MSKEFGRTVLDGPVSASPPAKVLHAIKTSSKTPRAIDVGKAQAGRACLVLIDISFLHKNVANG